MFKSVFIEEEGGTYNVNITIADKVIFLQNKAKALKAAGKYAEADKVMDKVYNIMDKALFELDAYPIEESEVA